MYAMSRWILILVALPLGGCCQWPGLKQDVVHEFRREVREAQELPYEAKDVLRDEIKVVADLPGDVKREFRRDLRAPDGILRDIMSLDCPTP